MGKRSDLTVSQRREVVLMLLRREEPAAKLARRLGLSETMRADCTFCHTFAWQGVYSWCAVCFLLLRL